MRAKACVIARVAMMIVVAITRTAARTMLAATSRR
jgi:hypothetical protein